MGQKNWEWDWGNRNSGKMLDGMWALGLGEHLFGWKLTKFVVGLLQNLFGANERALSENFAVGNWVGVCTTLYDVFLRIGRILPRNS